MSDLSPIRRHWPRILAGLLVFGLALVSTEAQQMVTENRDPKQIQDEEFAKLVKEWTGEARFNSPLTDHLPLVKGIPTPKDVLGYYIGAPNKLTYYADILKYYRALEKAAPTRVKVEVIGKTDEDRDVVTVYVSSDENIKNLALNTANLGKIADPRGLSDVQIQNLIATTKPQYHFMGGLHSSETGPTEMLMELAYRITTETSPLITQIRNNVIVSITPAADPDGRDRNVDWFYKGQEAAAQNPGGAGGGPGGGGGGGGGGQLPYWGKYVFHDNNRDFNVSQKTMRAIFDFYMKSHAPILHDLHEAQPLLYTYSGNAPQNPNLDPILWFELPFFSNFEVEQMTKWGMPGVYTHAFMDGWSPGYLGSVAYNHNAMMRMYETQSGVDQPPGGRGSRAGGAGAGADTGGAGNPGAAGNLGGTGNAGAAGAAAGGAGAAGAVAGNSGAAAGGAGAAAGGGAGGRGGGGRGGRGGGAAAPPGAATGAATGGGAAAQVPAGPGGPGGPGGFGGGGRGGNSSQRDWYRGLPVPPQGTYTFTRRVNTNYMETGVLSGLQIAATFPNMVIENFYRKTQNSIDAGKTQPPYGYVLMPNRDMTRVANLVNLLRMQGIEVGQSKTDFSIGSDNFPAGAYIVKRDQPYGRLAKTMLEKQIFPDPTLTTYDDSGWTQGLAFLVDVKEVSDRAILALPTTLVDQAVVVGKITGTGTAGLAIAHYGSNNMITFRYRLKGVAMKIAEKSFTAEGIEFPAGSFITTDTSAATRTAVQQLGLTAVALSAMPTVPTHDGDAPRIAIYSSWNTTQELGWYRFTFDKLGIPFDLIYKEQVKPGNLRAKYDVIIMAAQNLGRAAVLAPPAARPVAYEKTDKYQFLGQYGSSPDITGGMGQQGVDEFAKFLEGGGTLIAASTSVNFPIEFGFAGTVDSTDRTTTGFYAPRPIIETEILRLDHPVFYGYADKMLPVKYLGNGRPGDSLLRVGIPDQGKVLARYVGGAASIMSGFMLAPEQISQRPYAIDLPDAYHGKGRVILFANNPVYRWQNFGEFNMMFNAIMNWNDVPPPGAIPTPAAGRGGGGGFQVPRSVSR
jgi:hypothetical protein